MFILVRTLFYKLTLFDLINIISLHFFTLNIHSFLFYFLFCRFASIIVLCLSLTCFLLFPSILQNTSSRLLIVLLLTLTLDNSFDMCASYQSLIQSDSCSIQYFINRTILQEIGIICSTTCFFFHLSFY